MKTPLIVPTSQSGLGPALVRFPHVTGDLGFSSPGVELSRVASPMPGSEKGKAEG